MMEELKRMNDFLMQMVQSQIQLQVAGIEVLVRTRSR